MPEHLMNGPMMDTTMMVCLPVPANKIEVCRALDVGSGVQPREE